jgi:hypothetical protein
LQRYTQVDDSGHRIPRDAEGKKRESHWILQENTGNRWNMEAVFRPEIVRIFSGGFLSISCAFWQEPAGNHQKKMRQFSGRNTASTKSPELPGAGSFRTGLFDLGS